LGLKEIELKVGLRADAELDEPNRVVWEAERICQVKNTVSAKLNIQVEKLGKAMRITAQH